MGAHKLCAVELHVLPQNFRLIGKGSIETKTPQRVKTTSKQVIKAPEKLNVCLCACMYACFCACGRESQSHVTTNRLLIELSDVVVVIGFLSPWSLNEVLNSRAIKGPDVLFRLQFCS